MSSKLKLYLGRKVIESLKQPASLPLAQLKPLIQIGTSLSENHIELNLPINVIEKQLGICDINNILKIQPDDIIQSIHCIKDQPNRKISFEINRSIFIKDVIENCIVPDFNFQPKKIIVEYSSPNIAKPFHFGHLRSTIIGNFIGNLHNYLNNNVTRLNYLGDWGTQFGFIKVGVAKLNLSDEDIKKNPIRSLFESYVHANKLAESDPKINDLARQEFQNLENGNVDDVEHWKTYMAYTIEELQSIYGRLGMKFDEYSSESMYGAKSIKEVIEMLKKKNILKSQPDGKQTATVHDRTVTLIKSDGTTLYLTRDIAAAIDRFSRYKFDQMLYVVENGQNDHFNALKDILYGLDYPWAGRIKHIKFGRIRGMSTRKGNVVFLKDILDETQNIMVKKQIKSPNTKVPISDVQTSDTLGISCVIVNDLKQRRLKDYEFSWDRVLQAQGDTGVKLQYTHCRLCSLESNSGAVAAQECVPQLIDHPEVTSLVREIAKFHEVLYNAQQQLEACLLVNYLFHLCNHINRALKVLKVKGEDPDVASQRLLMFNAARDVLGQGMKILGIKPLTKM